MTTNNKTISVVYLFWLPYGIQELKNFIESYKINYPNLSHELVILFKSNTIEYNIDSYLSILHVNNINFSFYKYNLIELDLNSYQWICNKLDSKYILFFNTKSRILAPNWLEIYLNNFNDNIGMLSATGSFNSIYSGVYVKYSLKYDFKESFNFNFRKYKAYIKNLFYWQFLFPKFPNPHLRTNGFMIDRDVFATKIKLKTPIKTKSQAYAAESGYHSITNQILALGLDIGLVGKNGKLYLPNEWKNSDILWTGNQDNLLIADNQTDLYMNSTSAFKKILTKMAWGK